MTRALTLINLLGVLLLAALCAQQWRAGQTQEEIVDALSRRCDEQTQQIAAQAGKLKDDAADLADLRQRLGLAESQMKDVRDRLFVATTQRDAAVVERDELRQSLVTWQQSVADRDAAISKFKDQQQQLVAARDQVITQFNELAEKYNKLAAARSPGSPP